jgi:hypothetical protein
MPFKTPVGGARLGRTLRGVVMALIAGMTLAVVLPATTDAGTPRGSAGRSPGTGGDRLDCMWIEVLQSRRTW